MTESEEFGVDIGKGEEQSPPPSRRETGDSVRWPVNRFHLTLPLLRQSTDVMSDRKWLIVALLLGGSLRFVGLFDSPPGPNVDEVSNGIDARCIWQTGHDRHGAFLPFYLKAYDDYREGLFVIAASPLSEFMTSWKSLRLVAAIIGMLTIIAAYGAVYRIISPRAALWSALFMATDPQHVLWSRIGMEVILVPLGVALTWLALSYFQSRPVIGALATVASLLLTIYAGMMGKPAAAILFLASLFIPYGWFTAIRRSPAGILLAGILLCAGSIPALWSVFSPEGMARLNQLKESPAEAGQSWSKELIRGATYWSPTYLMAPKSEGMPDLPGASKMGYAEWGCLMLGMGTLLFAPFKPWHLALLVSALLAVVPAAFTNTIAPSRILWALPTFTIIMGLGTDTLTRLIGARISSIVLAMGIIITTSLVANDLAQNVRGHLDTFFWGDAERMAKRLHDEPGAVKIADVSIPYITEEIIHATGVPAEQFQGRVNEITAGRIPLARIVIRTPNILNLTPGTAMLTWIDRPTPGWETVAEAGRFKIVRPPHR